MLRHFQLFAPAPGREAEAESALRHWLEGTAAAAEFRGGAVLREYAGEFGDVEGALAVMYDVESREAGAELRRATAHVPNPMAQDTAGDEPPDQGAVLYARDHQHAGNGDIESHAHGDEDGHGQGAHHSGLDYNRGGGMLARLFHGHFTIVAVQASGVTSSVNDEAPA